MKPRSLILLSTFLAGQLCLAEINGRMNDAEFFTQAASKILILEYEDPFRSGLGRELAELNGHLTLATIQGVENFAVITLRQEERHLTLTTEKVEDLARRQRTPVVIWGEIYEQAGRVFITSHLRHVASLSKNGPISIRWNAAPLGIPDKPSLRALAPTSQVNFAPVEVSRDNLTALESFWHKSLILRAGPRDDASPSGELAPDIPHFLIESSGDWSKLKLQNGGSGWVRLTDFTRRKEFKDLAGVVQYAQGLTQFLSGNRQFVYRVSRTLLVPAGYHESSVGARPPRLLPFFGRDDFNRRRKFGAGHEAVRASGPPASQQRIADQL